MQKSSKTHSPWTWIPSLYFAQGFPYVMVMTTAVILFNRLGISNTDIALYTSWLYLPWVIKPLWSPLVDVIKTKRWWIVTMQLLIGAGLAGIAFVIPGSRPLQYSLAFMWLMAFSSATHDIAADGFYMLALDEKRQAYFVGIRNIFYRLAVIAGQGLIVIIAGTLEASYQKEMAPALATPKAWAVAFYLSAVVFFLLFLYHSFFLPHTSKDQAFSSQDKPSIDSIIDSFFSIFIAFFQKPHLGSALAFILFYRFAEAQLAKIASPFLLSPLEAGGLGLSTTATGFIYGTIGVTALIAGGILGGILLARQGLRYWLWGMTIAINVPNIVYLYLALMQPQHLTLISCCIAIEQLGYGFGFTSLTYFMMLFSAGKHQTAHYAICTGFMALGMMLPGMISGWIEEQIGYQYFFIWIMICTLPSFIATRFLHIPYSTPSPAE